MSAADKVFGISVSFLVGVSLGNLGVSFLTVLFISAAAACVLTIITKEKLWAAVFFVFVFAGLVYYHLYLNIRAATENLPIGKQVSFSGVVVSEPARYEKAQSFLVKLQEPFRGAVEVVTNSSQQMRYGDLLAIEGNVAPGENAAAPSQSLFPKIHKEDADRGSWIKGRLLSIKERFTAAFAEALPYDEGALLQGITLGSRAGFSKDLKESMKNSGTTHIVAMSGYNITILAVAIGCLLSYFLPRRVAFFFTVIAIALFVTMVGGEASVVRAAFMGILLLLCQTVGRPHDSRNAIALAASVMVLANPTIIINDLGFILSFMSLLGIVYLSPALICFRHGCRRTIVEFLKLERKPCDDIVRAACGASHYCRIFRPVLAHRNNCKHAGFAFYSNHNGNRIRARGGKFALGAAWFRFREGKPNPTHLRNIGDVPFWKTASSHQRHLCITDCLHRLLHRACVYRVA